MFDITLFVFTCFIGALLQSICGFGAGVFMMSVLPHFFTSYSFALSLSTISALVMCIVIVVREYKYINIRIIIPTIIGNASAITFIMLFWNGDTGSVMKKILGVFLILLSMYFIFLKSNIKVKPTFKAGILAGALGGAANSFFSMGGPPAVVYMIAAAKNQREYLASTQAYFCFSSTYVSVLRYIRGMMTDDIWPMFFAGLPFIALGTWGGLKLFKRLNEETLKFIVYIFMALSGAVMIFS